MVQNSPEEVVRTYYDVVDAEQYDELVALFAEDIRYERPGQEPLVGRESLRQFYLEDRPLDDGAHEIHSVVGDGETVAVRGTFSGVQNGETVEFDFADFHEFEGETIKRRYTFTDRDEI